MATDHALTLTVQNVVYFSFVDDIMGQIQIQAIGQLFTMTHYVIPVAKSAIFSLPCFCLLLQWHWAKIFSLV